MFKIMFYRNTFPFIDGAINHEDKRVGELTNDAFTSDSQSDSEDEARHYKQFINKPNEGGESEEKFNYKQFISESDDTSESSDDSEKSEDTKSKDLDDSSHDEESDMVKIIMNCVLCNLQKYQLK